MKGVILAGGTGTRLAPLTTVINKHLLPVYNKPMVFYSLECMVKSGVDEVLLVIGESNTGDFVRLLRDGKSFGLKSLQYAYQDGAGGIAQALGLARGFADYEPIVLMLGDNIVQYTIEYAVEAFRAQERGARVLLSPVANPEAYGIAELENDRLVRIVEKPKNPRSNQAVIGIYLYDHRVFEIVDKLKPSARGELEITDVNNAYLEQGELEYSFLHGWWADAGESFDYYLESCNRIAQHGANHRLNGAFPQTGNSLMASAALSPVLKRAV